MAGGDRGAHGGQRVVGAAQLGVDLGEFNEQPGQVEFVAIWGLVRQAACARSSAVAARRA